MMSNEQIRLHRSIAILCRSSGILGLLLVFRGLSPLGNVPLGIDYWTTNLAGLSIASAGLLGLLVEAQRRSRLAALLELGNVAESSSRSFFSALFPYLLVTIPIWIYAVLGWRLPRFFSGIATIYFGLYGPIFAFFVHGDMRSKNDRGSIPYKIGLAALVLFVLLRTIRSVL